jgi:two-component system aerobic respiration control sensor histidine kinase ArcB
MLRQKKSHNWMAALFQLPCQVHWIDTMGIVGGCNENAAKFFGFNGARDMIGKNYHDLYRKKAPDAWSAICQAVLSSESAIALQDYIHLASGNSYYLKSFLSPLNNKKGQMIGVLILSSDVTEDKNEITMIKDLIAMLPGHMWWTDREGRVLGCNNEMAKKLGFSEPKELLGKSTYDLLPDYLPEEKRQRMARAVDALDEEVMKTNQTYHAEEKFESNGQERIFHSQKSPIRDLDGIVTGTIGIAQDITELKKAQYKVESANKAKSEILANMSHDIRTPITGMVGMIYDMLMVCNKFKALQEKNPAMLNDSDPMMSKVMETIHTIAQESNTLMNVTDELLQFFNEVLEVIRLESGQLDYKTSSFNLHELVVHNCELLQSLAQQKNIALSFKIDANVPIFITGYQLYLDRVILNLVSNAIKFTQTGTVEIIVSLQDTKKILHGVGDTVVLELKVKDTGIGIPADKFDLIFEHFSRLSPSNKNLYKGAGMGLYTVKQYIEAMHGNIAVDSVVGKGSCFTVTAPFVMAEHSDQIRRAASPLEQDHSSSTGLQKIESNNADSAHSHNNQARILIVEDSPIAALTLKKYLTQFQCVSDIADTGIKAVSMANDNNYDLIFMDIGLPDLDGVEVTKRIHALKDSQKSQVPIIAVTGHGDDPGIRAKALDAGMQEVMSKPANPVALASHLEHFVFKAKQQEKIIDWEGMFLQYPDNSDFIKEMVGMFVDEVNLARASIIETFKKRDSIELRKTLHRIRGAITYLMLPQLEKSLEIFHKSVHDHWDDQNQLHTHFDAVMIAMDNFLKSAVLKIPTSQKLRS